MVKLATQQEASFLALEAREHVEVLEKIRDYGQLARTCWEAGCSTDEIRSLYGNSTEVN